MYMTYIFLWYFPIACGHLCLISPLQRGSMDISQGGSRTCFRLQPECGGEPPSKYLIEYPGGKQMWIKWQQNFNHYTVGYPGYMDIALAPVGSSTWKTLTYIQDQYFYAQDHQQNYTAIVVLPNIDCKHCVIRARYVPHKPGESTFYQCSDIAIRQTTTNPNSNVPTTRQDRDIEYRKISKKIDHLRKQHDDVYVIDSNCLVGFSYNPLNPGNGFLTSVNVLTGTTNMMEEFYINIALTYANKFGTNKVRFQTDINGDFVYDAISAINSNENLIQLYHMGTTADEINDFVMEIDLKHPGDIIKRAKIVNNYNYPISAILPSGRDTYLTVTMADRVTKGKYQFIIGELTYTAVQQFSYKPVIWTTDMEDIYVNFQWAEYDSVRNVVYLLMGNENSPERLQARIYTYDLDKRNVSWVEVDVDEFTFMSMHVHQKSGRLYTVSPGLTYHFNPYWSLIEVDPMTGKSKRLSLITDVGYFSLFYGGTIFNGIDEQTDTLYHVFRLIDTNADVIVGINLQTYKMTFSEITNLRHIYNLSYIRANNTCYN